MRLLCSYVIYTVQLTSVELAQAHPNNFPCLQACMVRRMKLFLHLVSFFQQHALHNPLDTTSAYRISLNRRRPRTAAASICCTRTRMEIIQDSHQASARPVHIVQLISKADSRTERLHVLLTVSNSHHCIAHIQPSLMSVGFPKR